MRCSNKDCRAEIRPYAPHWRVSADLSTGELIRTYVYCKACFDKAHQGDLHFERSVPQPDEAVVPMDGTLMVP